MQIPKTVKVGGMVYDVEIVNYPICLDGKEKRGKIDYHYNKIQIRNDMQNQQNVVQTFLHELVHAISVERGLDWGDNDELYTDEIAKCLHQIVGDNPELFK